MADGRVLEVAGDGLVAHPVEIIVGIIVFADMVEAEAEILPFAQPPHRRAKLSGLLATRQIAAHPRRPGAALGAAAGADAVEEGRVEIHLAHYGNAPPRGKTKSRSR